jgi:sugar O-acyltransferase (sialic acid O-acetyltransferase NeuD family)
MEKIILIGGGGHSKACIDVIETVKAFRIAGIIDLPAYIGKEISGYKIIASDKQFPEMVRKYKNFLVTVGGLKGLERRIQIFKEIQRLGGRFPSLVSSLAYASKHAAVGDGTIVMHRATLNAYASIGQNCIINTGAIVEHDVKIGDHCHISTGAIINGRTKVGSRVFVGSNSVVIDELEIADDVVIGAGCVVTKSIKRAGTYVGNPARIIQ